jgi:uncharacterized protein YukE
MASAYEVRQVAAKVKSIKSEIERRRLKNNADAKEAPYWWSGEASYTFSLEYKKIDGDIRALLDVFDDLEIQLEAMADAIVKAEELLVEE